MPAVGAFAAVPFIRRDDTVEVVVVDLGLAVNEELTVVLFTVVVVVVVAVTAPDAVFGRAAEVAVAVVVLVRVLAINNKDIPLLQTHNPPANPFMFTLVPVQMQLWVASGLGQ